MSQIELRKMLDDHQKWLKNETGGKRLDLSNANLRDADLMDADLSFADLSYIDLSYANLRGANLSYTSFKGANLSYANLIYADLRGANLSYANLSDANLSNTNLVYAELVGANLEYANLNDANLFHANLVNADLKDISVSENTLYYYLRCPEEGSYIGFKRCAERLIVKLEIPADAARSTATTNKCRASKAKVLEISDTKRKRFFKKAVSLYDPSFIYKVGEMVEVSNFNDNRWEECASGIHHFMTREEAITY